METLLANIDNLQTYDELDKLLAQLLPSREEIFSRLLNNPGLFSRIISNVSHLSKFIATFPDKKSLVFQHILLREGDFSSYVANYDDLKTLKQLFSEHRELFLYLRSLRLWNIETALFLLKTKDIDSKIKKCQSELPKLAITYRHASNQEMRLHAKKEIIKQEFYLDHYTLAKACLAWNESQGNALSFEDKEQCFENYARYFESNVCTLENKNNYAAFSWMRYFVWLFKEERNPLGLTPLLSTLFDEQEKFIGFILFLLKVRNINHKDIVNSHLLHRFFARHVSFTPEGDNPITAFYARLLPFGKFANLQNVISLADCAAHTSCGIRGFINDDFIRDECTYYRAYSLTGSKIVRSSPEDAINFQHQPIIFTDHHENILRMYQVFGCDFFFSGEINVAAFDVLFNKVIEKHRDEILREFVKRMLADAFSFCKAQRFFLSLTSFCLERQNDVAWNFNALLKEHPVFIFALPIHSLRHLEFKKIAQEDVASFLPKLFGISIQFSQSTNLFLFLCGLCLKQIDFNREPQYSYHACIVLLKEHLFSLLMNYDHVLPDIIVDELRQHKNIFDEQVESKLSGMKLSLHQAFNPANYHTFALAWQLRKLNILKILNATLVNESGYPQTEVALQALFIHISADRLSAKDENFDLTEKVTQIMRNSDDLVERQRILFHLIVVPKGIVNADWFYGLVCEKIKNVASQNDYKPDVASQDILAIIEKIPPASSEFLLALWWRSTHFLELSTFLKLKPEIPSRIFLDIYIKIRSRVDLSLLSRIVLKEECFKPFSSYSLDVIKAIIRNPGLYPRQENIKADDDIYCLVRDNDPGRHYTLLPIGLAMRLISNYVHDCSRVDRSTLRSFNHYEYETAALASAKLKSIVFESPLLKKAVGLLIADIERNRIMDIDDILNSLDARACSGHPFSVTGVCDSRSGFFYRGMEREDTPPRSRAWRSELRF